MSQTKHDSVDGVGSIEEELWREYENWSDSIEQPMTDEDYESMAAEMGII